MDSVTPDQIIKSAAHLRHEFGTELALGISGSHAHGTTDAFSDVDICVFIEENYPSGEVRRAAYAAIGFNDPIYFDIDFDTSWGDGFIIEDIRCDFNWMVFENIRTFLSNLGTDFNCSEWLPGGLASVKAIYDPKHQIISLQDKIPNYPIERSRHRIQLALRDAYYSLYKLGWLPKAVHRGDTFSFFKHQYLLLEKFFYAIFSLNRTWFSVEKRLSERIMDFEFVPNNADLRIQTIILHREINQNLGRCLMEIKSLFKDTAACAHQVYPDLDFPITWE